MSAGGFGSATHGTANMGTVSAQIIAANAARKNLLITNDGTAVAYLRLGTAAAVLNEGLRLAAAGSYEMKRGDGNLWSGQINGIVAGGTSKIIYIEGV